MAEVAVDTAQLRRGAALLSGAGDAPRGPSIGAGDLGSVRSDAAFSHFDAYWRAGRSVLVDSRVAMADLLSSAAATYERRDAQSAEGFAGSGGGARAF